MLNRQGSANRVLLITETAFAPPRQGDAAVVNEYAQAVLQAASILDVCHLHDPSQLDIDYIAMRRITDNLDIYGEPDCGRTTKSLNPDDWCPDGFADRALAMVDALRPAVVIAQTPMLAKCLRRLRTLSHHPVLAMSVCDIYESRGEKWAARGIRHPWFSTTHEHERAAWYSADVLLVLERGEWEEVLRSCPGKTVWHVAHRPQGTWQGTGDRHTIIYVGALNDENVGGLRDFIEIAFPIIRRRHGHAKLLAAGRAPQALNSRRAHRGIEIGGVVSSVAEIYASGSIAINPTPVGTGQSIKTVEALAYGRCVVTLEAGARGFPRSFPGLFIADSVEHMGSLISDLMEDKIVLERHMHGAFTASQHDDRLTAAAAVSRLLDRAADRLSTERSRG